MKQIYNLLQTIEDDKKAVTACEKYLHYLKGQLSVHEEALTRITSVPSINNITPPKEASRVRITQENWKSLGIEVGDTVEIVVSGDRDWDSGNYTVTGTEDEDFDECSFLILDTGESEQWYYYDWNDLGKDELYLIKQ